MDRRKFLSKLSAASAATIAGAATLTGKADALEEAMDEQLNKRRAKPNSCYIDAERIYEEVPALAYILGDEGSGSYYGKKLLSAYLYKKLPGHIHSDIEERYNLDKDVIFENVYR